MNKRLFVAGLPFSTTQDELKALFAGIGNVVSVTIITDRMTGRSKGFGFVEMELPEAASEAITKLNNTDFGGRKLIVSEAKPMEERRPSSGGYRGDGSRGGFSARGGQNSGWGGQRRSFGNRREGGRGSFGRDGGRDSGRGGDFRGGRH